jgi:hypothetical protein
MTWLQAATARVVARWTRLYTAGLPAPIRDRRREEIGADVHGQLDEARSLQGISGQQRSLTRSIAYLWLAAFAVSFLIARLLPARTTRPRHPIL